MMPFFKIIDFFVFFFFLKSNRCVLPLGNVQAIILKVSFVCLGSHRPECSLNLRLRDPTGS